ncbi:elongation factor P [Pelagerythrobacter marensis]|uniref:Elongation factor P n=1 Tax=Pelagerythrobacter marensis TaxID=543877 RepID=A0ABZ2D2G9_9SPHN
MPIPALARSALSLATVLLALLAQPAGAAPGGKLGTLPHGVYRCATPGDAAGAPWQPVPGDVFAINTASTYRAEGDTGTYLLTGDRVVFTRGPMKGRRFVRTGTTILREIGADGTPGRVRCVRGGPGRP